MNTDRSTSDAADQPCATSQDAGARSACYVDSAPLMDVMLDQLEYLVNHKGPDCAADCAACNRLQQVQGWLLLPFRV